MTKAIQPKSETYDLWSELDAQFDALRSRFFEPFGIAAFGPEVALTTRENGAHLRLARTDVTDAGASYKIVAEVPGIPKDRLDIRVRGSVVEIRGENTQESKATSGDLVHQERAYSGYFRALELLEPVVATEAKAKVENGLLELELPKLHPSASPDEVKIAVQ